MKNLFSRVAIPVVICVCVQSVNAQQWADSTRRKSSVEPAWNYSRLISMPTTKTTSPHTMQFYIMHRLGNFGKASGGGINTLYGFDGATDILLGFDFGITKNFMVGVSRSRQQELIDIYGKYRFLTQKPGGSPVSISLYEDGGIIPETAAKLYASSDPAVPRDPLDRFVYLSQLSISSMLSNRLSVELVPTVSHRNHVIDIMNYNNMTYDANDIFALGAGGRYKVAKHMAIVADYYWIFSKFRMNNPLQAYYNCLSAGLEIETGGHVFDINFSNASGLNPNNIIPNTTDTWFKGGFKLGFTLSRTFNL